MNPSARKDLIWVASTRKDFSTFPTDVHDVMGRALLDAQFGDTPREAKPLKGFGGAGVLELVDDSEGSTYRVVYTVRFPDGVYVVHCFQKKSTRGSRTPKHEIDLVRERLKRAERVHNERTGRSK